MAVCRVNMRYSMREAVELVLNEGSDPEDFFLTVGLKRTLLILAWSLFQKISRRTRVTTIMTSSFLSLGSMQPVE